MTEVPTQIGPYRTTHVLGQGGMGVVYAGEHLETGERAAIKTVSQLDEVRLSQIRKEIHSLTRLRHPGVVRILGSGVDQARPWYAMEWLEAETLAQGFRRYWEQRWPLTGTIADETADLSSAVTRTSFDLAPASSVGAGEKAISPSGAGSRRSPGPGGWPSEERELRDALSRVRRLCEVLTYVHGEGVVHRDLKPSNVFVRPNGFPVLADFGLAADVRGVSGREVMSPADRSAGSVAYMSPEQIRGEMLDARSDLYAVGCLLYELVCGRLPFRGTAAEIIDGHLDGPVVSPASLNPQLPEPLVEVLLRLLAKDRDARIGYAADVTRVLEEIGCDASPWPEALPRSHAYLYRAAFVGRDHLVQQIRDGLEACAEGRGSMLVLAGGSGAGKTRLALEASLMARARGMRPLAGECLPLTSSQPDGHRLQATPLGPLAGVVQAIADACLEGGKQATSKLLGEGAALLAGHFPALAALPGVADLPEPPALTGDAARVRFLTAISDTLKAFAAERPVLLLVDDLQWADELTVAFLEHLGSGSLRQMRLMVVGTLRTDEAETVLLTRIRKTADRRLDVGRMSGSEVSHLLGGMLAMPHPPRGLVDFLVNHTDGNPFFVTQYLRMAVAEQMLVRDRAGRWTLAEGVAEDAAAYESLPLPRSLREVIELRLQRLSPGSLVVLKVAAILGRRFDLDVLASVVDADESAVLAAVDEMALRQVIESDDAGGFHLTHDRLRENVLAGLGETDRRRLHQRVAEFFEARLAAPSPSGEANHAELGYHWSEAGMPAKAVGYLRLAGDRAQALYAADQAIELYRAALEQARLAGDDARVGRAERRELQEKLGDVLALRGQRERARDAYAQALTQAQPEENVVRARLHRKQGKTWETDHDHERALAAYESAYGALGECPETTAEWRFESMQAALDRIWVYYWLVRVDQMNAELERIRPEVEERGLPLQRYHYHMCVALRDFRHERYRVSDATLEHARQMLAAAREADSLAEIAFARFVRGFGLLFAGHLNEAEAELMESRELCRRIGDVSSETRAAAYLVLVHRRSGRVEAARCEGELLLAQARERKMDDYRGVAEAALGWAALRQGDVTAAAEWSQSAIETWKGLSFPYPFQWCAALTLLKLQLHQAPLRQLIALVQLLQNPAQLRLPDEIEAAFSAAIAAREDGDQQGVGEALDRALGQAQRLGYL